MGCRLRLSVLSTRAPAPGGQPGGAQVGERVLVAAGPLGLPNRFAVPLKTETLEVATLPVLVLAPSGRRIEILEPQQELAPALRANSQAASAVRRFPMWRVPWGSGRNDLDSPAECRADLSRPGHRPRLLRVAVPFRPTIAL